MTTTSTQVAAAFKAILQSDPTGGASGLYATSVAAQINQGLLTFSNYETSLLNLDQTLYTTTAALVTIDAFYGATPSAATLANVSTATSGTAFTSATQLHNLGYSDANVWTVLGANFASDPNSNFNTLYKGLADGSLNSYTTFIDAAYTRVFGGLPSATNLQNLLNDIPGLTALLSGAGHPATPLQIMGGLLGYLLYSGQSNGVGNYAASANAFLTAAANAEATAPGSSSALFGPELLQQFPPNTTGLNLALTGSVNGGAASATEGSTATFHITSTGGAGTLLNYTISGVTAAEVQGGNLSGQVTIGADGTANIGVTLINAPGEGLAGTLGVSVTLPSGTTATTSVPLSETQAVVNAATIATANGAAGNGQGVVVVNTPTSGADTVTIQFTGTLFAKNIVVQGNANVTVADIDGAGSTVIVPGSGANTVNISKGVLDSVTGGTSSTNIVTADGFTAAVNQNFDGGTGAGTLTVQGKGTFTNGGLKHLQTVALANGASATFTTQELATAVTQPVPAVVPAIGPSISVATGGTGTLVIDDTHNGAGAVDLSGKLHGVTSLTVDNNATVTLSAADIAGLTSVSTQPQGQNAGTIVTTVAGAVALLAIDPIAVFTLSDTPANLLAAPASVLKLANSVQNNVTIAQAVQLHTLAPAAAYTVSDTPADYQAALVFDDENNALVTVKASEIYTSAATVGQAQLFANLQNGNGITIVDTAANVGQAISANQFPALNTNVTGKTPNGVSSVTVSGTAGEVQANALAGFVAANPVKLGFVSFAGTFAVTDTVANIAGLSAAAVQLATGVSIKAGGGAVSVAALQAAQTAVGKGGKTLTGTYALVDSATNLNAAPAIVAGSNLVTVTDPTIGVAVAAQVVAFATAGVSVKFNTLADTALALTTTDAALLADATAVQVVGNATVAQAAYLAPFVPAHSILLADNGTNLAAASNAVLSNAATITVVGALTAAQALTIFNQATALGIAPPAFEISDQASALAAIVTAPGYAQSVSKVVLNSATKVTVSDASISVAVAAQVFGGGITNLAPYVISDTVKNVVAAAANPAVNFQASSISASGNATVAQANTLINLAKFDGIYSIVDTAASIVNALGNLTLLNGSANPVTFSAPYPTVSIGSVPSVTVAQATALLASGLTKWSGTYTLADSVANLQAANAAVTAAAVGNIYALDSVASLNNGANVLWVKAHTKGYVVQDTFAAINAIQAIGAGAVEVVVIGQNPNLAQAQTLFTINPSLLFAVTDFAGNLTNAALGADANGIRAASQVTILGGGISAAIANGLLALNTNKPSFSLLDTGTALASAGNAAALAAAQTVSVKNGATVAQAAAIVAGATVATAANATTYSIVDSTANINAATAKILGGASGGVPVTVTDGNRVTLTVAEVLAVNGAANVNLAGWQTSAAGIAGGPVTYNIADTMANLGAVANNPALADAGTLTAIAGGVAVSVGLVQAVQASNAAPVTGSYALKDTFAALSGAPAIAKAAASVTATDASITAASAIALVKLAPTAVYTLGDTAGNLTLAANAGVAGTAAKIIIQGVASAAQVQAIESLNSVAKFTYTLTDTAANLAAAPAAVLKGATAINFTTAPSLAQLSSVDAAVGANLNPAGGIVDTAANLSVSTSAVTKAVLNGSGAVTLSAGNVATAAQGAVLDKLTFNGGAGHISYTVSDTAAAIATTGVSFINATAVTATGSVTAAQGKTLSTLTFNNGGSRVKYSISDTAANLLSQANTAGWAAGTNVQGVTVTDTSVNIATAEFLNNNNAGLLAAGNVTYTISDAQDRIIQALGQFGAGVTGINLNQVLGNAASVSIDGTTAVPLALVAGRFVVSGSVATIGALKTLSPTLLSAAGYVVNDTIANEQANLTTTAAGFGGNYIIADTEANIIAAAPSFVQGASKVQITDTPTTFAFIEAVKTVNGGKQLNDVSFSLTDTAANLFTANALNNDAGGATAISVTTALNGAQAANLVAIHPAKDTFTISDTGASLFQGGASVIAADVNAVKAAASVKVTGVGISDAQATSLVALNSASTYSIVDNPGSLFNVANGVTTLKPEVANATTVSVNGFGLNVAQAALLTGLGAKFVGGYILTDKSANLAAASGTVLQSATAINQTDIATIAQATQIDNSLASSTKLPVAFTVSDTVANILGAPQSILTTIANLTVSANSTATADQAQALQALTFGAQKAKIAFGVKDTSANILTAGDAAGIAAATAQVTVTDQISINTATQIAALNATPGIDQFSLTDLSINYGNLPVVKSATAIEVTDVVSVGEAALLNSYVTAGTTVKFDNVTDSLANLAAPINQALLGNATTLNVSDATDSVAQVEGLRATAVGPLVKLGSVAISDTAGAILTALRDPNNAAVITGAKSVTDTSPVTVSQAQILESLGNLKGTFGISDTLAFVNQAPAAVLNSASVNAIAVSAFGNNNGVADVFNDSGISKPVTITIDNVGGGGGETIGAAVAGTFTGLFGVDLLTLNAADTLNLHGYGNIATPGAAGIATALPANNTAVEITGNIQGSAVGAGTTFAANPAGNSTMLLWNSGGSFSAAILVNSNPALTNIHFT